jgi:Flp pilus assembly protein TadG
MRGSRNGNNIIEFAFMLPWYVFLFVGAVDMGLYSYASR